MLPFRLRLLYHRASSGDLARKGTSGAKVTESCGRLSVVRAFSVKGRTCWPLKFTVPQSNRRVKPTSERNCCTSRSGLNSFSRWNCRLDTN